MDTAAEPFSAGPAVGTAVATPASSLSRKVRSVYAQILRARQHRVVVLTEPVPPSPHAPVILVGCHRSGTSLVRRIVDSHSRFACPPESHFLGPLLSMLDHRRSMVGLESMGFNRAAVVDRMRGFAEQFFLDYAAASGKARWADKTPAYTEHLDALEELFGPTVRYVMIYRHGLDVTRSITTALPDFINVLPVPDGPADHPEVRAAAGYWAETVNRMLAFERKHPERVLRLRYERLTREPEREMRNLFAFLDEPFEAATLDFNARPHDEGLEDGKVRSTRTFEPVIGSYLKWDAATLSAAVEVAGPALEALGYRP